MSNKASRFYGIGLSLLAASAFVACSAEEDSNDGNGGRSSGSAGTSAGTAAGGSSATAGSTGTSGSGTAGTGTGTAGSGTSGGSTGTAGSGTGGTGGAANGFPCAGMKPTAPLITEFADLSPNATTAGQFTYVLGLPGGTFAYQPAALTVTDASKALNVKGSVKNYDGFGVYFGTCTDASAYSGVSFSIKGNAGPTGKLSFRFQTNSNMPVDAAGKKGVCAVPAGTTDPYPLCHAATYDITVAPGGGTVEVKFSEPMGGVPVMGVNGKDVVGLEWAFPWAGPEDTAYDVDVTVDDLKFTGGGNSGGSGGSGGSAGSSGGGAGGSGGV